MNKAPFRPSVEALEARCVPTTARLSGDVLAIAAPHGPDHIGVRLAGASIKVSGVARAFNARTVGMLAINVKRGNDVITIDPRLTMPVVVTTGPGRDRVVAGGGPVTLLGIGHVTLIGGHSSGLSLVGNPPPVHHNPIVFAAINLTPQEQVLLELVNRARANPTAEANLYHIALNEGISSTAAAALALQGSGSSHVLSSGAESGPISSAPKQPLAPNAALYQAAVEHSQDMLNRDYFAHPTLGTGVTPQQRDLNDGYDSYYTGENIGEEGSTLTLNQNQAVYDVHQNLFVDSSEPGRGHRLIMMNPNYNEIGPGVRYGPFTDQGTRYNSIMVTEDFGSSSRVYLTGVMYHDGNGNRFYDVGEGSQGATIQATNEATGQVYVTTTGTSGGYAMPLPAGTYSVTWSSQVGGPQTVTIGGQNVKLDMLV
jgi:hypothetical protein